MLELRREGLCAALTALSLLACSERQSTEKDGRPSEANAREGSCETGTIEPGQLPLQRLTRDQYNHVVADLLGVENRPADELPPEEEILGFDNNAAALQPSQFLTEKYQEVAEAVAGEVNLTRVLPCALDGSVPDACALAFIERFASRAYRRPLTEAQRNGLFALYAAGKQSEGVAEAIRWTIQAVLQSPFFLYRPEVGEPTEQEGVFALTPDELATRLSFLLWQSVPDESLWNAARSGGLSTAQGVAEEARRMLDDPRARRGIAHFHRRWLKLDALASTTKDPDFFPFFEERRALFQKETELFLDHVFWEGEGRADRLFLSDRTFANGALANFYGVPLDSPEFIAIAQPPRRAGILTQGSFLAAHAKPDGTSPIDRGRFIREQLLCTPLPPPPEDAPSPPEPAPELSTRDRFAQHSNDSACAGCHVLIDPLGFGLEEFDGAGGLRAEEAGRPIDSTGALLGGGEQVDGPFDGAAELSAKLANSPVVMDCIATQWFRYAYGRVEQEADGCSKSRVETAFRASGFSLRELVIALTQTDAFRYRRPYFGEPDSGDAP